MRSLRRLVLALVVALALPACGTGQGEDPSPRAEVVADDAPVRLVEEPEADLVLYVSNQSFEDEEVRLRVAVDGTVVVDDDFHVEGQHSWSRFPLALAPGSHDITAESDSGASLRESFRVPGGAPRYAVVDHWGEEGSAELTWGFQRNPLAFD